MLLQIPRASQFKDNQIFPVQRLLELMPLIQNFCLSSTIFIACPKHICRSYWLGFIAFLFELILVKLCGWSNWPRPSLDYINNNDKYWRKLPSVYILQAKIKLVKHKPLPNRDSHSRLCFVRKFFIKKRNDFRPNRVIADAFIIPGDVLMIPGNVFIPGLHNATSLPFRLFFVEYFLSTQYSTSLL